jgi:hypothetical protein
VGQPRDLLDLLHVVAEDAGDVGVVGHELHAHDDQPMDGLDRVGLAGHDVLEAWSWRWPWSCRISSTIWSLDSKWW